MAPPQPPPARRRDRAIGAIVVVVGVVVAVLSVLALIDATNGQGSDVGNAVVLPSDSAGGSSSGTPSESPSTSASSDSDTTPSTTTSAPTTSSSSAATAGRLPLIVLNNTTQTGLAQSAAATFTQGGWTVSDTSNFSGDILSTCAYFDPNVPGARAAAKALMQQFPAIKRIKQKFEGLPAGPVIVMLTTDYTAQ